MKNKIKYSNLLLFTKKILKKAGLDKFSINSVATGLCETSLRGVESHGIRLLPHYVNSALHGRKNPKPKFKFKKKFLSIGVLNADNAFGHAAGYKAIEHCLKMSKKYGVGVVAVQNSSHPGAMASMAMQAARKGHIALAFTHADSLVLSHNGTRPYFGTNPICVAVPRKNEEPYCLDMATSMISWNKLLIHKNSKIPLKNNLAADKYGKQTNDANLAKSLFGAGNYKGYGLASFVEILCGIYTGMDFGRKIPAMYTSSIKKPRKLGQFYLTLRADGCISNKMFLSRMLKLSQEIRKEPRRSKEKVMLPNDIEIKNMKRQKQEGILLSNNIVKKLSELSRMYKVKLNFFT